MKIANVIFEEELINHNKVEYINYYNDNVPYINISNNLPILYVGWSFMKKCNIGIDFIKNIDILEKRIISNELYWEFSYNENKTSHINGVENFIKNAPNLYFSSKYNYINLDPVFFQLRNIEDLIDIVPKKIEKLYNYKNEIVYFLYDNKITGLNLKQYDFFKFDVNEIIQKLTSRTGNVIIDIDGEIYKEQCKIFPNFQYLRRYIVIIK